MTSHTPGQSIRGHKDSIAVLDIGSSKIACFIAEPDGHGVMSIIGIGHHHAKGIRASTVTDSRAAETSIAAAVNMAEQMAQVTVDNVLVSLSSPDISSHQRHVELNIAGNSVTDQDIAEILSEAAKSLHLDNRQLIHSFLTQYQLDGAQGIRDPRNMYGNSLKAEIHMMTADQRKLINLANTVSRCHLDVAEFMAAPHAAGLGCLQQDERELGVTVIDMGAETTSVVLYAEGAICYCTVVPLGANHVTRDLAQGLSTTIHHAERIKNLHGSVLAAANDEQHMVPIPPMDEETELEETSVPRTTLVNIIHPRIEEIFELVYDRIEDANMLPLMHQHRHIVLTGGGSQLVGVRELVATIFSKQVRIGKPRLFPGLAESVSGPGFSAPVGMLFWASERPMEDRLLRKSLYSSRSHHGFSLTKLASWLKARF